VKKIETHPDSPLAIGNAYKEQSDPVTAIKTWKIRLTAETTPEDIETTWEKRIQGGDWESIGIGKVVEWSNLEPGKYDIRCISKDDPTIFSETRSAIVADLEVASFEVEKGGDYVLQGNPIPALDQVIPPSDGAVRFKGKIQPKAGSPEAAKIEMGFIQELTDLEQNARWVAWPFEGGLEPLTDPPELANGTTYFQWMQIIAPKLPAGNRYNDAPPGKTLYAGMDSKPAVSEMGELSTGDTPKLDRAFLMARPPEHSKLLVKYVYDSNFSEYKAYWEFRLWLVAFVKETNQYQPFQEAMWKLDINFETNPTGPWAVDILSLGTPTIRPTSNEDPSSDVSDSIQNGPEKVFEF